MWYEDVVCKLNGEEEYTRQQIYEVLVKEKPELTLNSFKWIISEMVDNGIICRKQRGKYVLHSDGVAKKFVCFESVQLNEFLNHLIGRNTFFVLVEKDAVDFVFRYLQEETDWNVLLKPNEKEWDAYCTGDNIVMLNLVSEAPKCVDKYHSMCIEQMLVDIVAEKSFKNLYSKSELQGVYNLAEKSYLIDYARLLRYARRRGKADEIKKYI